MIYNNPLEKDVVMSPLEISDGEGQLKATVSRGNVFKSEEGLTKNFWRKHVNLLIEYYEEKVDEDGEFIGYGDIDKESGVLLDLDADQAERLANWLIDAAAEIRDYSLKPRVFYDKRGTKVWDEEDEADQIDRFVNEGGTVLDSDE